MASSAGACFAMLAAMAALPRASTMRDTLDASSVLAAPRHDERLSPPPTRSERANATVAVGTVASVLQTARESAAIAHESLSRGCPPLAQGTECEGFGEASVTMSPSAFFCPDICANEPSTACCEFQADAEPKVCVAYQRGDGGGGLARHARRWASVCVPESGPEVSVPGAIKDTGKELVRTPHQATDEDEEPLQFDGERRERLLELLRGRQTQAEELSSQESFDPNNEEHLRKLLEEMDNDEAKRRREYQTGDAYKTPTREDTLPNDHGPLRRFNDPTPRKVIPTCSATNGEKLSSVYPCQCGKAVCGNNETNDNCLCFAADDACLAPQVIPNCSATNGEERSSVYPCQCGKAVCEKNDTDLCFAVGNACLAPQAPLTDDESLKMASNQVYKAGRTPRNQPLSHPLNSVAKARGTGGPRFPTRLVSATAGTGQRN